ncbi:hypothetical protein HDU81_004047 [Chytriomyces hyalinus]|nr:hypothetical protein HDU81_004047 [Chytriomyces hyalinus]
MPASESKRMQPPTEQGRIEYERRMQMQMSVDESVKGVGEATGTAKEDKKSRRGGFCLNCCAWSETVLSFDVIDVVTSQ